MYLSPRSTISQALSAVAAIVSRMAPWIRQSNDIAQLIVATLPRVWDMAGHNGYPLLRVSCLLVLRSIVDAIGSSPSSPSTSTTTLPSSSSHAQPHSPRNATDSFSRQRQLQWTACPVVAMATAVESPDHVYLQSDGLALWYSLIGKKETFSHAFSLLTLVWVSCFLFLFFL